MTREITDQIPKQYVDQIQGQMEVLDVDECDFVQYRPKTMLREEEFLITRVKRDPAWAADAIPRLRAVWEEIKQWQHNEASCRDLSRLIANAAILGQTEEAARLIEQRQVLLAALKPEPGSRRRRRTTTTTAATRPRSPSPVRNGICLMVDDEQ